MAFATDSSLSVKEQLKAALAHIVSLETIEQEIGAQLQDANEAGEAQAETIAMLTEENEAAAALLKSKDEALAAKDKEIADIAAARDAALQAKGDFDKSVEEAASRKAFEIASSQGVPASLVPAAKPSDGTGNTVGTVADLWAQYDAIPDAGQRFKFYTAHREEFLKAVR